MKLDYDAELKSTKNYEVSGDDKFCKKPIADPRKAGEVWVDDEGISPVQQRHLHARRLCGHQGQGQEDQRRLCLRHDARHQVVRRSGLLRGGRRKSEIAPFLLKKDAEASRAKINGKVLGFEDALKSVVSGGETWKAVVLRCEQQTADASRETGAEPSYVRTVQSPATRAAAACALCAGAGSALNQRRLRAMLIGAISLVAVPAGLASADEISRRVLRPLHQRAVALRRSTKA